MKFSEKIAQDLIQCARVGNKRSTAARNAGISPSTLTTWLRKGLAGDAQYEDFAHSYLRAEAEDETRLVGLLKDSLVDITGKTVPSVAMYLLNHRHGWDKVSAQIAERFIDYLVGKLSDKHPELLDDILQDLEAGAID